MSQFCTSCTKCKKTPKNITFDQLDVTDDKGSISDHISGEWLPLHIKLSTDEVYRLRKFSTVLRIHSSSKKDGAEEYFAELQLYSPWRTEQLKTWEDPETCVKEYQDRQKIINKVKTMTYPGP